MQITVEGRDANELLANFQQIANRMGFYSQEQLKERLLERAAKQAVQSESQPEASAEKPRRGRARAESLPQVESPSTAPETDPMPVSDDVGAETQPQKEYTKDDCSAALRNVAAKRGAAKCAEILKKYSAEKVSKVPADKYAAFIADCEEAAK